MPAGPRAVLYPPGWEEAGLVAQTDWATGCIRWFVDHEEWLAANRQLKKSASELTPRQWFILESHAHESAHVLQITSTGFAYDLSYRLFSIAQAAAQQWKLLEAIHENSHEYAEDLQAAMEVLDRPGPGGITPRAILESLAFVQQKRAAYRGLTLDEMLHLLTADLEDSVYRSAFDVAAIHLGEDAMRHFVHVANLSLFTTEPQTVFVPLLEEFAARASKLNLASNHRIGTEFLGRRFPGMILGTAESLVNGGMEHPALAHIAADVANHARLKIGDYARLYAGDLDQATADLLQTTTFFPVTADGRIPMVTSRSDILVDDGGPQLSWLRYLNAVTDILIGHLEPSSSGPVALTSVWVPTDGLTKPPDPILVAIDRKRVSSPADLAEACRLITRLSSDPRLARAYRGMLVLYFGDEDWHPDLIDPEVRACLRYFFDQFPHLLYFLLADLEQAEHLPLNFVWAAYAPEAQDRMPDGRIRIQLTQQALAAATQALRAAADFAELQGEPGSTMLVHLENLPPAATAPIRSQVFG